MAEKKTKEKHAKAPAKKAEHKEKAEKKHAKPEKAVREEKHKPAPAKPVHKKHAEKRPRENDIGIDVSPPEKECSDLRCPWHGTLPIRGKVFRGVVESTKMHGTAVIEWGYNRFMKKYESYERRKSRVMAHNPPCVHARDGDQVVIAECRPLSKTKSFVVVGVEKRKEE